MKHSEALIKSQGLTLSEYEEVSKRLGREPNLPELGIFAAMWSEHCSYKSSRIYLKRFPTKGPQVIQGPGENAGVVSIGEGWALSFKMESHNHPSYIEPYQGAATGVGGILRDVFTMGARPIAILDSLRFGAVDHPKTHHLVNGVVSGIAGYGNCMGIPTVGGETTFDPCYNGNILVNAMAVGLLRENEIYRGSASGVGNPVIYLGAKTGRDGIHGATMASDEFSAATEEKRPTVQVGDPFTEKLLMEACLELMKKPGAIVGIQDMGAAGLTSSSFEMAHRAGTGLRLALDQIPMRETGMTPYELLLSESQERMLLVAAKGREAEVFAVFSHWGLDACTIGEVVAGDRMTMTWHGETVVDLPISAVVDAPVYERPLAPPADLAERQRPFIPPFEKGGRGGISPGEIGVELTDVFFKLLSSPNLVSRRSIWEQYDHMVMANTVVLPGSDAAVLRIKGSKLGVAVTANCNSRYVYLDPFEGGKIAVAESARNLAASGAKPLAITDCLNFGSPERPETMWQFREAVAGISEACLALDTPVVSGNVSFYNETEGKGIYPTPTIGMVGVLADVSKHVTQWFQAEGDLIYLLGETRDELGGSEYLAHCKGSVQGLPPRVDLHFERVLCEATRLLIEAGLVRSAHDLSEGGLAIALAEAAFHPEKGPFGFEVELPNSPLSPLAGLFSETQGRMLLSLSPGQEEAALRLIDRFKIPIYKLGRVGGLQMRIMCGGRTALSTPSEQAFKVWSSFPV